MKMIMTQHHGWTALIMAAAIIVGARVDAAPNAETYKTRLSVVPIDVGMQATVAGQGSVTATLAGNKLTVSGTAEGLRSPATVVHIHRGPPGIPGPAILDLTITNTTTPTISGTVELSPSMVADLKNGQLYVQLSSERAPDGNLRGWLMHAN
jgi:CHRD domain